MEPLSVQLASGQPTHLRLGLLPSMAPFQRSFACPRCAACR